MKCYTSLSTYFISHLLRFSRHMLILVEIYKKITNQGQWLKNESSDDFDRNVFLDMLNIFVNTFYQPSITIFEELVKNRKKITNQGQKLKNESSHDFHLNVLNVVLDMLNIFVGTFLLKYFISHLLPFQSYSNNKCQGQSWKWPWHFDLGPFYRSHL